MRAQVEFDWDDGNLAECQKHGVSIDEIETAFQHEPRTAVDAAHSLSEERFIAIVVKGIPRPVFVIFTRRMARGREIIRPISARYMHRKELDRYA